MKDFLTIMGIVVAAIIFGVSTYQLAKHFNYSFMYRDMVKETIREMVKDEALRK